VSELGRILISHLRASLLPPRCTVDDCIAYSSAATVVFHGVQRLADVNAAAIPIGMGDSHQAVPGVVGAGLVSSMGLVAVGVAGRRFFLVPARIEGYGLGNVVGARSLVLGLIHYARHVGYLLPSIDRLLEEMVGESPRDENSLDKCPCGVSQS